MARKNQTPDEPSDDQELPTDEETMQEDIERPRRHRGTKAEDIGDKIAKGIAEGMASLAPKRIKPGSTLFDPRRPGKKHKGGPRLRGTVYDNGIALNEDLLTDHEVELLNAITRGGRYFDRHVEVVVSDDAGSRVVMLRYPDRTIDQRLENTHYWRSFSDKLEQIIQQQDAVVLA